VISRPKGFQELNNNANPCQAIPEEEAASSCERLLGVAAGQDASCRVGMDSLVRAARRKSSSYPYSPLGWDAPRESPEIKTARVKAPKAKRPKSKAKHQS
jgi:hypothetical protein